MDGLAFVTFVISTLFFIMWVCVTIWEIPTLKKLKEAVDTISAAAAAGDTPNK